MPGWELAPLARRLEAAGFPTHRLTYHSVRDGLDANVDRLRALVDELAATPGVERIHFVGHSLGGVLIVKMFEHGDVPRAGRIVCLGSPLNGTEAGRRLGGVALGRAMVGHSIRELVAEACAPWRGQTDLGIIAGDAPLGLGQLVGRLPRPHDGTVSVAETKLPGATEHVVLHCTHLSMLVSSEVISFVIEFLEHGRFPPQDEDVPDDD